MDSHFQPSAERAAAVNQSMAQSLRHSLYHQLQALQALPAASTGGLAGAANLTEPLPADYLAWFDLLAAHSAQGVPHGLSAVEAIRRANATLARLTLPSGTTQPSALATCRITTLAPPHYVNDDIAALLRWWDTEPDNAMDLQAVTPDERDAAIPLIQRALHTLRQSAPALADEWRALVCEVVLAQPGNQHRLSFNGVSSFAAWGAIGINLPAHTHWTHFLKTLVHEAGHLMLFGIAREQALVTNDPADRQASPLRFDPRPMDGIFHAAYVSAREALAFDACLNWMESPEGLKDDDATTQLENQLEDSVLAFWECCEPLQHYGQLTQLGQAVLCDCQKYMKEAFEVRTD